MNIDENVRKLLMAILRKWKVIVLFAIIGALAGYFYTANFTQLQYTSTIEFLAYATDSQNEINDSAIKTNTEQARISNTSRMNYAMNMLSTYIEIMKTNEFTSKVAQDLNDRKNSSYTGATVKNAISIKAIENTAMFKITVTTSSADLSYEIAHQMETSVPQMMNETNSGLISVSVEDKPIKASAAGSLGYAKKCSIAAAIGVVIAVAYIILRNLLDVRVRSSEELIERYNLPVLGNIPSFEIKSSTQSRATITNETAADDKAKGDE